MRRPPLSGTVLDKMQKRVYPGRRHVRILLKIPIGVKKWIGIPPFPRTMTDKMKLYLSGGAS